MTTPPEPDVPDGDPPTGGRGSRNAATGGTPKRRPASPSGRTSGRAAATAAHDSGPGAALHRAEQHLAAAAAALEAGDEVEFQRRIDALPRPVWLYDRDALTMLRVNTAALHAYGYTRARFLTLRLRDIRPANDVPRLEAFMAAPRGPLTSRRVYARGATAPLVRSRRLGDLGVAS